jgi:hypothetical protein
MAQRRSIIGVAPVDNGVIALKQFGDLIEYAVDHRCRQHKPDCARRRKCSDQRFQTMARLRTCTRQFLDSFGTRVEHGTAMARLQKPPHHVRAHAPQSNHADLHTVLASCVVRIRRKRRKFTPSHSSARRRRCYKSANAGPQPAWTSGRRIGTVATSFWPEESRLKTEDCTHVTSSLPVRDPGQLILS